MSVKLGCLVVFGVVSVLLVEELNFYSTINGTVEKKRFDLSTMKNFVFYNVYSTYRHFFRII